MSDAIAIVHGSFGRATLYTLDTPMIRHVHRDGHLIFALDGPGGSVTVGSTPIGLTPRRAVAVNTWEIHSFAPGLAAAPSRFLVLYIRPGWFGALGRLPVRSLFFARPAIEVSLPIEVLVGRVVQVLLGAAPRGLLTELVYDLTVACIDQTRLAASPLTREPEARRVSDFRVRKSLRLMQASVGSAAGLAAIAAESGLSRPHFFKMFRHQTGLTPKLFWNTLRMERACAALAESPRSVTEIGLELGFASQSSFSRFFALNTGLPPSAYRRAARLLDGTG
jgi:AraC-like DNA-binding protein